MRHSKQISFTKEVVVGGTPPVGSLKVKLNQGVIVAKSDGIMMDESRPSIGLSMKNDVDGGALQTADPQIGVVSELQVSPIYNISNLFPEADLRVEPPLN